MDSFLNDGRISLVSLAWLDQETGPEGFPSRQLPWATTGTPKESLDENLMCREAVEQFSSVKVYPDCYLILLNYES